MKQLDGRLGDGAALVELAEVENKDMQVLYLDESGNVHVMDSATFEQAVLPPELFGEGRRWLGTPELAVAVSYFQGAPVA
ncbi:Elongation factor P, partial [Tetrabaena socialis]